MRIRDDNQKKGYMYSKGSCGCLSCPFQRWEFYWELCRAKYNVPPLLTSPTSIGLLYLPPTSGFLLLCRHHQILTDATCHLTWIIHLDKISFDVSVVTAGISMLSVRKTMPPRTNMSSAFIIIDLI